MSTGCDNCCGRRELAYVPAGRMHATEAGDQLLAVPCSRNPLRGAGIDGPLELHIALVLGKRIMAARPPNRGRSPLWVAPVFCLRSVCGGGLRVPGWERRQFP